jgi:hypothetical protein
MDGPDAAVWLLGDLDDPWVGALLGSLRLVSFVNAVNIQDAVHERPFDPGSPPRVLVLHRSRLNHVDVSRLERWSPMGPAALEGAGSSRLVLCYGPYVRHSELERCGRVFGLMLPEATAAEVLAGRLPELLGWPAPRPEQDRADAPRIEIVSTEHALRSVIAEACESVGYRVAERPWPERDSRGRDTPLSAQLGPILTVWDVPVLEPEWPTQLAELSRAGPVVALLGFADRETVRLAREQGAAACLDVPFHVEDLLRVVERVGRSAGRPPRPRAEAGHSVPPRPSSRRREAIRDRRAGANERLEGAG